MRLLRTLLAEDYVTSLAGDKSGNDSFNTILAGVMLDLVDEEPPPYFCAEEEWEARAGRLPKNEKQDLTPWLTLWPRHRPCDRQTMTVGDGPSEPASDRIAGSRDVLRLPSGHSASRPGWQRGGRAVG